MGIWYHLLKFSSLRNFEPLNPFFCHHVVPILMSEMATVAKCCNYSSHSQYFFFLGQEIPEN